MFHNIGNRRRSPWHASALGGAAVVFLWGLIALSDGSALAWLSVGCGAVCAGIVAIIRESQKARRRTLFIGPYCRYTETLPPAIKRRMSAALRGESHVEQASSLL